MSSGPRGSPGIRAQASSTAKARSSASDVSSSASSSSRGAERCGATGWNAPPPGVDPQRTLPGEDARDRPGLIAPARVLRGELGQHGRAEPHVGVPLRVRDQPGEPPHDLAVAGPVGPEHRRR